LQNRFLGPARSTFSFKCSMWNVIIDHIPQVIMFHVEHILHLFHFDSSMFHVEQPNRAHETPVTS